MISLGIGDPDLPTPEPVIEAAARAMRDPATHDYPTNHGTKRVPRGRRVLLPRPVRRRPRGRRRDRPRAGREGRRLARRADRASIPATSAWRRIPATRRTRRGRSSPAPSRTTCRCEEKNGFLPDLDSDPGGRPRARQPALPQLPEQPDRRDRARGLLRTSGRVRPRQRPHRRPRQRVLGDLLRGLPRPELPRDARGEGGRRRDLLAVQGLEHDRLALRPHGGQRGDRRALPAAEDEHRLGHVRGDAGRRRGGADGGARLSGARCPPSTSADATWSRTRCARSASTSRRPLATPYFWARVPEGYTSGSFSELVLERAAVVVSPGSAYGPSGEGFVRISLTVPDDRLEEAVSRIESALTGVELQSS